MVDYDCDHRTSTEFSETPEYRYVIDTTTGEVVAASFSDDCCICSNYDGPVSISAGESGITEECEVVSERTCRGCCGEGVGPFPCTELGIREAIAAAGGPHRFDCAGPTTVSLASSIRVGSGDVILDGEGNLTVEPRVVGGFSVLEGIKAEFRGFTVSGSGASYPAGTFGFYNSGSLTLVDSTVSGHVRGGILSPRGTVALVNSTVSGNSEHAIIAESLAVTSSTVSGSTTAIQCEGICTVAKTLIRGICTLPIGSEGYNIESPGNTCGFDQATDQVDVSVVDLKLGPLADNGGPTMTHALLPGSVAIDQIPAAECLDADGEPLTTDQRGEPRPAGAESKCDVGSFEAQPAL